MEGTHRAGELGAAGAEARELERCFHRFGAGVAEEGAIQACRRDRRELRGEFGPTVVAESVRERDQPRRLLAHRREHVRMAVT